MPVMTSEDDAVGLDLNAATDPAIQSTVRFPDRLTKERLLLSAVLEPDADRDVYGDQFQDACPADATAHVALADRAAQSQPRDDARHRRHV